MKSSDTGFRNNTDPLELSFALFTPYPMPKCHALTKSWPGLGLQSAHVEPCFFKKHVLDIFTVSKQCDLMVKKLRPWRQVAAFNANSTTWAHFLPSLTSVSLSAK